MPDFTNRTDLSPDRFKERFSDLTPLILDEWAFLKPEALNNTHGDLDLVVEYIADQSDRTRTLVRRQLTELYQLADQNDSPPLGGEADSHSRFQDSVVPTVEQTLRQLEKRAEKLLAQVEREVLPRLNDQVKEVLPELNERVREKPGASLLTAFGIGFLIGMIFGGFGRGRG
jgi:ElaB/YqjD/DUF883 family membrane-anchored ribosome-binding protein